MSDQISLTIASGTALSPSVDLGGKTLVGIAMPAAWTPAVLSFQVSIDGGTTYLNSVARYDGVEMTMAVAAGQYWQVDQALWRGITNLRIRSGNSPSPVNQAADRVLTLVVRYAT